MTTLDEFGTVLREANDSYAKLVNDVIYVKNALARLSSTMVDLHRFYNHEWLKREQELIEKMKQEVDSLI